jgi:hypothetical protein
MAIYFLLVSYPFHMLMNGFSVMGVARIVVYRLSSWILRISRIS